MGRLLLIILLLLLTVNLGKAQYNIEGIILDDENKQPIGNANVFLEGVNVGSATNKDGKFSVGPVLGKYKSKDLIISCMGYKTILIPSDSIRTNKSDTFYLKENAIDIKEVEITESFELQKVGYLGFGRNDRNNFFKALKENWATKLNNEKPPVYIDEIQIYGKSGLSNRSPKLRIGFHTVDSVYGIPDQLIAKQVIGWPHKKDKSRWASFEFQEPIKIPFKAFYITFERVNLDSEFALGYRNRGVPSHFDSHSISKQLYGTQWDKFDGLPIIRLRINKQEK